MWNYKIWYILEDISKTGQAVDFSVDTAIPPNGPPISPEKGTWLLPN